MNRTFGVLGLLVLLSLASGSQIASASCLSLLDEGAAVSIGVDSADDSGDDFLTRRDRFVPPAIPPEARADGFLPDFAALLARPVQHPSRAPPTS